MNHVVNKEIIRTEKEYGHAEKARCMLIAIVVAVLYFTNTISGTLSIVLGIVSFVFSRQINWKD